MAEEALSTTLLSLNIRWEVREIVLEPEQEMATWEQGVSREFMFCHEKCLHKYILCQSEWNK